MIKFLRFAIFTIDSSRLYYCLRKIVVNLNNDGYFDQFFWVYEYIYIYNIEIQLMYTYMVSFQMSVLSFRFLMYGIN